MNTLFFKFRCLGIILVAFGTTVATLAQSHDGMGMWPPKNAVEVNVDTKLVISFGTQPRLNRQGIIRIYDAKSGVVVDSIDTSVQDGPTDKDKRVYGPECDYTKVPYDYSRTEMATNRNTIPGTPSGTAERTPRCYQLSIIGGFTDGFHFHPVTIKGDSAIIQLHHNMLEYGHNYLVTIDKQVFSLHDCHRIFEGISKADQWSFSTRQNPPKDFRHIAVNVDGSGDFSSLQGALDFIPDFSKEPCVITIAEGDYEEIVYARNKQNLTILGAGMDKTIVHYANNEVFNPHPLLVKTNEHRGTFPSRRAAVCLDNCSDITLQDMTVATDLRGQAEGLLLNGERIKLVKVHIVGSGDALQANGTIFMEYCRLDGGGDTILGRGSLFARRCQFVNDGGPFTWVRNGEADHGDVFVECSFDTSNGSMANFGRCPSNHGTSYPYAECVLIDCSTGHIIDEGWGNLGEPTVVMLEFNTHDLVTGNKVDTSRRHKYAKQLDAIKDKALIEAYSTPSFVLKGWDPYNL